MLGESNQSNPLIGFMMFHSSLGTCFDWFHDVSRHIAFRHMPGQTIATSHEFSPQMVAIVREMGPLSSGISLGW